MINCPICGKPICNKEIYKHYKITLGNLYEGIFHGNQVIYYHKECLESLNKVNKRLASKVY